MSPRRRTAAVAATLGLLAAMLGLPGASATSGAAAPRTITGSVSAEATGLAQAGATVEAFTFDPEAEGYEDLAGSTTTGASGRFSLLLPADRYALRFSGDDVVSEYWEDEDVDVLASVVDTTGGPVSGIDALVNLYPRITGTITGRSGRPLQTGLCARPVRGEGSPCVTAQSDADGRYALVVRPGDWVVSYGGADPALARGYHPDAPTFTTAVPVTAPANDVVVDGVDVTAQPAASIAGRVLGRVAGRPAPVATYVVTALQLVDGAWVRAAQDVTTPRTGAYRVESLRAGSYRLRFEPNTAGPVLGVRTSGTHVLSTGQRLTGQGATLRGARPVLSGTARAGSVLTVTPSPWPHAGARLPSYSWLRDGRVIPSVGGASYRLTSADVGRRVTARLTYVLPGRPTTVLRPASVLVRRR